MPYGRLRFEAKTSGFAGAPPAPARNTSTRPAPLSARKMSPLGATRRVRGCLNPPANTCTAKPSGTFGSAPCGAFTTFTVRPTDFSASVPVGGAGKSEGLMWRRTPGASTSSRQERPLRYVIPRFAPMLAKLQRSAEHGRETSRVSEPAWVSPWWLMFAAISRFLGSHGIQPTPTALGRADEFRMHDLTYTRHFEWRSVSADFDGVTLGRCQPR